MNQNLIVFGNQGHHVLQTKQVMNHPAYYQWTVEKPASVVWGCISAYGMASLNIWKGTINAEEYIEGLEQHMLPSRHVFQKWLCIFQEDNAKPHTESITTACLHRRGVRVLNWRPWCPDLPKVENVWHIIKKTMDQQRSRTVEQLESCIKNGTTFLS